MKEEIEESGAEEKEEVIEEEAGVEAVSYTHLTLPTTERV